MRVTKRADLLAKMKREEAERRAEREFAAYLEVDTLDGLAADLFYTVKTLTRAALKNVEFRADICTDAYDGLEAYRVRLARQGVEVEWREILPDYLKDMYGRIER